MLDDWSAENARRARTNRELDLETPGGGRRRFAREECMSGRRGMELIVLMIMIAGVAFVAGAVSVARAEEQTLQITAPWEGRARIFVTGEHQAYMLGVFAGRLTADKQSDALHDAQLLCPGAFDADYATNAERGE